MTTKQLTSIVAILLLGACLFILLPIAYLVIRSYWNYQTDLNTLNSIATQLGYTPDRRLNFYEAESMEYDYLGLVFYTQDSVDQFSVKVQFPGFTLEHFYPENRNQTGMNASFLGTINYGLKGRYVTLNGRYKSEDFVFGTSPPLVSKWKLYSSTVQRTIEVHYGRVPSSTDAFIYDGKPLRGNVVVVMLHRPMCWGC